MSNNINKVLKENPDADEALLGLAEELDEKHSLAALAQSEGGQLLLASLLSDIASSVLGLSSSYKDASHIELIGLCAKLDCKLDMYRALKRAPHNKKVLEDLLAEALT